MSSVLGCQTGTGDVRFSSNSFWTCSCSLPCLAQVVLVIGFDMFPVDKDASFTYLQSICSGTEKEYRVFAIFLIASEQKPK